MVTGSKILNPIHHHLSEFIIKGKTTYKLNSLKFLGFSSKESWRFILPEMEYGVAILSNNKEQPSVSANIMNWGLGDYRSSLVNLENSQISLVVKYFISKVKVLS